MPGVDGGGTVDPGAFVVERGADAGPERGSCMVILDSRRPVMVDFSAGLSFAQRARPFRCPYGKLRTLTIQDAQSEVTSSPERSLGGVRLDPLASGDCQTPYALQAQPTRS